MRELAQLQKPASAINRLRADVPRVLPQRQCSCRARTGLGGECEQCRKKKLQRTARPSAPEIRGALSAPPIIHEILRSPSQPLDPPTRVFFEARFDHDFSQVRVHVGAKAAESARAVNALAFTVGSDIVFGAGQFLPGTAEGRRLLAHELAHVVQSAGRPATGALTMDHGPSDSSEQAAKLAAQRVVSGEIAVPVVRSPAGSLPLLQRYTVPSTLACDEIVDWLSNNSPYAPEWAETRCTYSFNGGVSVKTNQLSDGTVKADVKGHDKLTVSVDCPIDRPEWNPSRRSNRDAEVTAFKAMRTVLDKHEAEHRKIGHTWRGTLESRFRAVNFSVGGADKADATAKAQAELDSQKQQWGTDAQTAQDAIDPFRGAVLTCP